MDGFETDAGADKPSGLAPADAQEQPGASGVEMAPSPPPSPPPLPVTAGSASRYRGAGWGLLIAGVVAALGLAVAGVVMAAGRTTRPVVHQAVRPSCGAGAPRLTVRASGTATATPDLLTVTVEVDTTDPTASGSLSDNNAKAAATVAAFKANGVAAKDIQTSGLSVQPQYSYPNQVQTLTGYEVTNTVTATLRVLSHSGAVIDAVAGAAGNAIRVDSISFSVDNPTAVESRARTRAVRQAVGHAKAMAAAAGERLGAVCSLTDQTQVQSPAAERFGAGDALAPIASSANVPIEPGTQSDSAQVSMVYSLVSASAGSNN